MGETFSCTLCANHELPPPPPPAAHRLKDNPAPPPTPKKFIRDVRIEAEMKTPTTGAAVVTKLDLTPPLPSEATDGAGIDLDPSQTLQRIVRFGLKDEGNHVLGVTVSYYEATETSGRTRTFRKLYQFVCKPSLIVRTKASPLVPVASKSYQRRWALEAQLENCSDDAMQLDRVLLELESGLRYWDCNWETSRSHRPVLQSGETEQVCFVIEEEGDKQVAEDDGRIIFGVLGIGWRGEIGSRGYLATGKLGTRHT